MYQRHTSDEGTTGQSLLIAIVGRTKEEPGMTVKAKESTAFDTDVLIIGGGFGGLSAAIRIKELSPETSVLMVDKQTIGWGGKANKGAGVLWVLAPGDDIDAFVDYVVVLDTELGSPVENSVAFVLEKYGETLTDAENGFISAAIQARLAEIGG